jgi:hypothetical protein
MAKQKIENTDDVSGVQALEIDFKTFKASDFEEMAPETQAAIAKAQMQFFPDEIVKMDLKSLSVEKFGELLPETQKALSMVFKENYPKEAFHIEVVNHPKGVLNITKELALMDDILTHQIMGTYRNDIKPLLFVSKQ